MGGGLSRPVATPASMRASIRVDMPHHDAPVNHVFKEGRKVLWGDELSSKEIGNVLRFDYNTSLLPGF